MAKAELGYPNLSHLKPILAFIRQKANSNEVIFPYSYAHIIEITTHKDPKKRETFANLVQEISRGICLKPFNSIILMEVENKVKNFLNIHDDALKISPFADDILSCWGAKINWDSFKNELTEQQIDEFKQATNKELKKTSLFETIEWFAKSPILSMENAKMGELLVRFKNVLKKRVRKEKPRKEKVMKDDFAELQDYYNRAVIVVLDDITNKHKRELDPTPLFSPESIKDIPWFYNFSTLGSAEILKDTRKSKASDLLDMAHLSCAITYCDVIVSEKFWTSICKELKLDKKYTNVVTNKIEELKKLL